jgi:MFS family permease
MLREFRRYPRLLSRNAWLYLISNTIQAVTAGALAVLYTLFLTALGYDTGFIGLLAVVGGIGAGLVILLASPLVHRWGWRTTLLWSDLIGGVALAAQLIYPLPIVLLVTTLGVGVSVALFIVVNSPFLAANTSEEERTAVFGFNNALGFLAGVAGLLLGGFLPAWLASPAVRHSALITALEPWLVHGAKAQTYQLALLVTGALALPSIVPVLLLTEPPRSAGRPAGAPLPTSSALAQIRWPSAEQRRDLRRWTADIALGPIGRFATTQALVGLGAGLFGPYLNLYFVNVLGASTQLYSGLAAGLSVLLAAASLVIVPLANRLGKIRSAVVVQASSLPFLLLLGLAPSLWIASVAFLIRGPLMNAAGPPLQAYLMESVATDRRVIASSVYNVTWQLASVLGAGAGGFLILHAGYPPAFIAAAGLYTISVLLIALWFGWPARGSAGSKGKPSPSTAPTPSDGQP